MMWNVQWFNKNVQMDVCMCVYVKTSENLSFFCAETWCALEANATLLLISFSLILIHGLGFYDLNFLKNFCNCSNCCKFCDRTKSFFIKRSMFRDVWNWFWKKATEAFRFYQMLNFSKKQHFRPKFREFQVLSQIVLYNCR